MCILHPRVSLGGMMSSASFRRSLYGWWVKLSGSMAYFRRVLILKALSDNIERVGFSLLASKRHGDSRQLCQAHCMSLKLRFDLDMCGRMRGCVHY